MTLTREGLGSSSLRSMRSMRSALETELCAGRSAEQEAWAALHAHPAMLESARSLSAERMQLEEELREVKREEERVWRERTRGSRRVVPEQVRTAEQQWVEYRQAKRARAQQKKASAPLSSKPRDEKDAVGGPQLQSRLRQSLPATGRVAYLSSGNLQAALLRREAIFEHTRRVQRRSQAASPHAFSSRPSTAPAVHSSASDPRISFSQPASPVSHPPYGIARSSTATSQPASAKARGSRNAPRPCASTAGPSNVSLCLSTAARSSKRADFAISSRSSSCDAMNISRLQERFPGLDWELLMQ